MKQYLDLLRTIKEKGTHKPAARENMPGTTSLFGYQFRHNLAEGFPLLTTKKMFWKGVVIELLWFLNGGTNIKNLVDHEVNIWNEDAFNFYLKKCKESNLENQFEFDEFIDILKNQNSLESNWKEILKDYIPANYELGDVGYQYGKVWRSWEMDREFSHKIVRGDEIINQYNVGVVDQISNVINSLKNNPESRRHIVTAIDPAHDNDLALYWCHAMFQFNCRSLTYDERFEILFNSMVDAKLDMAFNPHEESNKILDENNVPKYYLDCQLYQRSADVFLGVPFNIASYALLTHIIAKICNMIPGEFIHTFGDVHIYDNHMEAVNEQLTRKPGTLPTLKIRDDLKALEDFEIISPYFLNQDFKLENYNPQPSIKAELSTGLIK